MDNLPPDVDEYMVGLKDYPETKEERDEQEDTIDELEN